MRKQVLIFAGGGLGHVTGGVGTLLRYLIAEWDADSASVPVRIIDTRGCGGPVSAVIRFWGALATLLWGCLTNSVACAHINMTTRGSAARKATLCMLARLLGLPVILHLHGADFFDFYDSLPAPARRTLRTTIAGAGCIVVMGDRWRNRLVRQLGIAPDRVHVIRNGVPTAPRAVSGEGPARILFLGRLGPRKGLPELITALSSPELASREWSATIAGDGDTAPFVARIEASGLAARIAMPGWLDQAETARALAGADLLVLPSHHEVMPIAILEAMARGLAIVATHVGAIPEFLEHGETALLVPPGDTAALADAIATLIDDAPMRRRLGAQARRCFAEHLDIAVPAAALQALYREAAASGSGQFAPAMAA